MFCNLNTIFVDVHYFLHIALDGQAICKLPFIDESRLLSEIAKVEHTLTVIREIYVIWNLV
jgi:hypothetical protein